MKTLYVDIDGVVRDMCGSAVYEVCGIKNFVPKHWKWFLDDKDIYQIVAEDFTVLGRSKPTPYYKIIYKFACNRPITFLSCQPKDWVPHTNVWLKKHFGKLNYKVIYFDTSKDKCLYFKDALKAGVDGLLIEDYPFVGLPKYIIKRIILIHYPYNRETDGVGYRIKTPRQLEKVLNRLI